MKLYINPAATTSRAVIMFCRAEGVDAELVTVDIMSGEHHAAEYAAINPNRLVPALADDDFVLTEAAAILRYLAAKTGSALYPTEPRERARVDELMSWFEANFYKDFGYQLIYPQLFEHHSRGSQAANDPTIRWGQRKSNAWLQVLDAHYLAGRAFVAGDRLTIADLLGVSILSLGELVGFSLERYPNVRRWYDGMRDHAWWSDANGVFEGFAASLAGQDHVGLA